MERLKQALVQRLDTPPEALHLTRLPVGGEGLDLVRITRTDTGAMWMAKKLDPRLHRERDAYLGPLADAGVAPAMTCAVETDGALWIVMQHAGEALGISDLPTHLEAVARLTARIHSISWRWSRRLFRFRPIHVEYGRRHLHGEWRIAHERLEEACAADKVSREHLPEKGERRKLLSTALATYARFDACLIHGDLQPVNVVRSPQGICLAVDWSRWGKGSPLIDLAGITLDLDPPDRERFVRAYTDCRGIGDSGSWSSALASVLPLRQFLSVGVLAHYARHGKRPEVVRNKLQHRLDVWNAARESIAQWT